MKRNPLFWKLAVLSLAVLSSCVATGLRCPDLCFNNTHCWHDLFCAKWVGDCDGLGMCVPRPQACPEIYDPVCGCDRQTYSNDCFANAAGVNIVHEGPCGSLTCLSNEDCPAVDPDLYPSEYCEKEIGDCEGTGICVPRPEACYEIYAPVCGCDGNTYSNACEAAREGINVLADVSCDEILCDPVDCGPSPAMPNYLCEDGTLAGPTGRCLRGPEGVCGWEIRDCPS